MKLVFLNPRRVIIKTEAESEKLIPLTDEQIEYYKANPNASYDEVWNIGKPELEQPKPPEIPLNDYKQWKIQEMSQMSFNLMNEIGIAEHTFRNETAISIVNETATDTIKRYNIIVPLLKAEFYRLEEAINNAENNASIDEICRSAKFAEIITQNLNNNE
jgi:hypothetical protein